MENFSLKIKWWLIFKIIAIFGITLFSQNTGIAQNRSNYIQWVKEIPAPDSLKKQTNFFTKISNFLFGEESIKISRPISCIKNYDNSIVILDQGNRQLLIQKEELGEITQFQKKISQDFPSLVGVCHFINHKILFTDSKLNQIYIANPEDGSIKVWNKNLELNQPTGIAYSTVNHEILIVETGSHQISVLNEKGERIRTIGKRGVAEGSFNYPTFIWIDQLGTIYVVDSLNFRVQIFNSKYELISVFGENGDASGYMARPKGIATDSKGNIYIADALFHVVQIFDRSGKYLYQFGKQGKGKTEFWMPSGIYIDKNDRIYVSDSYNSRIQVFQRK